MDIPKVFISYSHDSLGHKQWVLNLATRLRNNGIDAILDQWELEAGDDLPTFMEKHLSTSNYIIMICTERYVKKANKGDGGVGYEKMIITSNLLKNINENKIIPIIKQKGTHNVPTFLKTKLFVDLSLDDEYEFNFDNLLRTIHKSPLLIKPKIGDNPFKNIQTDPNNALSKSEEELLAYVVEEYNNGEDYIDYKTLVAMIPTSRIMADFLIKRLVDSKLISTDEYGDIYITDAGKFFALENKLV